MESTFGGREDSNLRFGGHLDIRSFPGMLEEMKNIDIINEKV